MDYIPGSAEQLMLAGADGTVNLRLRGQMSCKVCGSVLEVHSVQYHSDDDHARWCMLRDLHRPMKCAVCQVGSRVHGLEGFVAEATQRPHKIDAVENRRIAVRPIRVLEGADAVAAELRKYWTINGEVGLEVTASSSIRKPLPSLQATLPVECNACGDEVVVIKEVALVPMGATLQNTLNPQVPNIRPMRPDVLTNHLAAMLTARRACGSCTSELLFSEATVAQVGESLTGRCTPQWVRDQFAALQQRLELRRMGAMALAGSPLPESHEGRFTAEPFTISDDHVQVLANLLDLWEANLS